MLTPLNRLARPIACRRYNLKVLKSHVTELKRTVEEVTDFPAYYIFERNLFFWADMRAAAFSLFSGVWWQVVVTYPQYLPASFPGVILVIMTMNYVNRQRAKHQIQTKPSFLRLCCLMLSLPFARPSPLVTPRAPRLASSMSVDPKLDDPLRRKTHEEEEEWWIKYEKKLSKKALNKQKTGALAGVPVSSKEMKAKGQEVVADAASVVAKDAEDSDDDDDDDGPSLAECLAEIEEEVQEHFDELTEIKVTNRSGFNMISALNPLKALNPLALLLRPVQQALGKGLQPVRAARRLLVWEDRILSTWFVFLLMVCTLVFALIPWAFVLRWTLRLVGLAIFGPHMRWAGPWFVAKREEKRKKERDFRRLDAAGKKALLEAHRNKVIAEHKKRLEAEEEKQSKHNKRKLKFLKESKHLLVVEPSRSSARLKYRALADPYRSYSLALETAS